jgi:hypothetical protein
VIEICNTSERLVVHSADLAIGVLCTSTPLLAPRRRRRPHHRSLRTAIVKKKSARAVSQYPRSPPARADVEGRDAPEENLLALARSR